MNKYNRSLNEFPQYIIQELNMAFHNTTTEDNYYPIWNDKVNDYLLDKLFPPCDFEEVIYNIDNAYKLKFDFSIGVWRVTA